MNTSALTRFLLLLALAPFPQFSQAETIPEPLVLGNRLELFADDALIGKKSGDLTFQVHRPTPQEVVLEANEPWEGNTSGYFGVFQDGELFRMVYRGWQHNPDDIKKEVHPEVTCLAVSEDGINWTKPVLGINDFEGSKGNNIIKTGMGCHNFTAFVDTNPNCPPDAKYKALGGGRGGLVYFKSADCKNWEIAEEKAVITDGAFDSQNLAFWDPVRKEYRAYWRIFTNRVRAIRTATSKDFVNWENQADLTYPEGTPTQHLYTNAVQPYFRAPHLFIGFPTRYLPAENKRVEPIFMISRDGVHFTRYDKAVVPESAPKDRQGNRSNYMTWGILSLPGKPDEVSVYATEAYYGPVPGRVRRFTYRVDGFVSLRSGVEGGEFQTRQLTFDGSELVLNYAAQENGFVRVEILDSNGKPLAGLSAQDALPLTGDSTRARVLWKGSPDLADHVGKPVTLRFELQNADLYSMRFE